MIRKAGKLLCKGNRAILCANMAKRPYRSRQAGKIKGKRILLVDDSLATGGTVSASVDLIEKAGGIVAGTASD